ncbi:MAG TPA: MFS transporter [bacterium]|nr:MFS transporter [bacterium]
MPQGLFRFFRPEPSQPLLADSDAVASLYRRLRWRNFLSITLGYAFFYTTRLSFSVVKKPLLDAGLLNAEQMGLIGSALLIAYAFGKTLNGFFADHASPRKLFATGLLVSALANIFFGVSSLFPVFLILWAVNGWFQSVGVPVSGVVLSSWFTNGERGSRYSIWSVAHNLGEGMTFTATAFLVGHLGWRAGFLGPGSVCLLVAVVLFWTLSDRPEAQGLPPIAEHKNDFSGARDGDDGRSVRQLQWEVIKNPFVWMIGIASSLLYVVRYAVNSWGILYLQLDRGYSLPEAGFAVSLFPIIGIAGTVLAGPISDKFFDSRRAPVAVGYGLLLIVSLGFLLYAPPGMTWLVYAAMAAAGFAVGGQLVFLGGLAAMDISSRRASGAALGLIGGFSYLGAAIQDFLSGHMLEAGRKVVGSQAVYDFSQVKIFWLGAAVLSFLFALSIRRAETRHRESLAPSP